MDSDEENIEAKRLRLESEILDIESWLNHPCGKDIFLSFSTNEEQLVTAILDIVPKDVSSFFEREQFIGALRGIRSGRRLVTESLAAKRLELKELK